VILRRTLPVTPGSSRPASPQIQAAFENAERAFQMPPPASAQGGHEAPLGLWRALGLALLGGLVLNLMPCVLPVLALKAMALMQSPEPQDSHRRHGMYYGVGVVGTTLALGAVVMAIRAAGHSVGWGFQFQEPLFIATVAMGLLLFAASCFGLFEISHGVDAVAQAHHRASGSRRSLLEGVLAVLVATPCSAPFLGTAVAFALAQPNPVVALIFGAIGVGLAAPFVALAFVPALGHFVPRPGPWMAHLKVLLGFCLLGTCVWLVWLFGRARGVDDGAILLGLMLLGALGAWGIGLWSAPAPGRLPPALGAYVVLLALLGHQTLGGRGDGREQAPLVAPFSEALVAAELQAGRPVLVDFTADWCITCKFNELHVLSSPVVQKALADRHVTVLRADFTRRDGALLAVLMRHGRAGVPMYLLYSPTAADKPLLLPELLTISTLTAALQTL
jgi:thiol:disulfide interchange protein DsbD